MAIDRMPDIAAGRLRAGGIRRQLPRPASAARPAPGLRRGGPLLFLLRRALRARPARPASTSRCSSARSWPTTRRAPPRRSSPQNILGGMCARVCPTETLCEQACVREAAEGKPVRIGELQRYATDMLMASGDQPFSARRADRQDGRRRRRRPGRALLRPSPRHARPRRRHLRRAAEGRRPQRIRHRRLQGGRWLRPGGGRFRPVDRRHHRRDRQGARPRFHARRSSPDDFDAVFLAMGLGGVNALGLAGEEIDGVDDAVDYIADLRQATDLAALPVGRRVVVVGGGMTAIDIASQSKRLGAEDVTIVYRRGPERMGASDYRARARPDRRRHASSSTPCRSASSPSGGRVVARRVRIHRGERRQARRHRRDVRSRGRRGLQGDRPDVRRRRPRRRRRARSSCDGGRIKVDAERRTSMAGVWAGGDCIAGGEDLTVVAVEDGKIAAESINRALAG